MDSAAAPEKKLSVFHQGILMGRKLSTTFIVGGTLVMLAGLIFLASSLWRHLCFQRRAWPQAVQDSA